MDFTREPIIETVITPKEGCKIVVRSSKSIGQEEYFVDSLEVVSFGNAMFFRSLEKPKAFLVPASDYEILEVREARMVLKNVGLDRSIKIGGGREPKVAKEVVPEKTDSLETEEATTPEENPVSVDNRAEKKRDRRRQQRRRRGREEIVKDESVTEETSSMESSNVVEDTATISSAEEHPRIEGQTSAPVTPSNFMSSILPPPPTLISETIGRYKENVLFKNAFYTKEEAEVAKAEDEIVESLAEPMEGAEVKEEKILEESTEGLTSYPEEPQPTLSSFWETLSNEPTMPSLPPVEPFEGEEASPTYSEEKKEEDLPKDI
ncbi:MAG: hypothetical protein BGO14_05195 [Chlamydiales bacterium 38-26]|nr:hypothetical protein [Chlamydiales bacterium]OJV07870.1 MAG: hypothetical protein BGO14_05195 [Chlamydiales bacterium 38-26]